MNVPYPVNEQYKKVYEPRFCAKAAIFEKRLYFSTTSFDLVYICVCMYDLS